MTRSPSEIARNTAGACRFAALSWREAGTDPQRSFVPTLERWAANAEARAAASEDPQRDLFGDLTNG